MLQALPQKYQIKVRPMDLLTPTDVPGRFEMSSDYKELHKSVVSQFALFFANELIFLPPAEEWHLNALETHAHRLFLVLKAIMQEQMPSVYSSQRKILVQEILHRFLDTVAKQVNHLAELEAITTRCICTRAFLGNREDSTVRIIELLLRECRELRFAFCHYTANELIYVPAP